MCFLVYSKRLFLINNRGGKKPYKQVHVGLNAATVLSNLWKSVIFISPFSLSPPAPVSPHFHLRPFSSCIFSTLLFPRLSDFLSYSVPIIKSNNVTTYCLRHNSVFCHCVSVFFPLCPSWSFCFICCHFCFESSFFSPVLPVSFWLPVLLYPPPH